MQMSYDVTVTALGSGSIFGKKDASHFYVCHNFNNY